MTRLLLLPLLFLCACATSRLDSRQLFTIDRPYNRVLVLYYSSDYEIDALNEQSYQDLIQPAMTSLRSRRYTEHLNKALKHRLGSKGTIVLQANELFLDGEKVPYDAFLQTLQDRNIEAVLVVNNYSFWVNDRVINGDTYTEPNAGFDTYLFDTQDSQLMWQSHVEVNGTALAGFDTINNRLAARIARDLRAYQYIYPEDRI